VTVTDTLNRFVLGLQKQDFQLFEDDVEQNLTLFSGEDAPLSVGVLFDESGSMGDKLRTSRDAAVQLLNTLDKEDEAFLVEFADLAKVSIGFTGHAQEIQTALKNAQAGGLTAMLDAIDSGLVEMKKARNSRKAIVVVSDGGDNRSHYTASQIESFTLSGLATTVEWSDPRQVTSPERSPAQSSSALSASRSGGLTLASLPTLSSSSLVSTR